MRPVPDLDRLLHSDLSHSAADAARPPDFAAIERRAAQRNRTRTMATTGAAAAVLIVLAMLGTSLLGGSDRTAPPAKDPSPQPTWTPPATKNPSPRPSESALVTRHWTPLRPDTTKRVQATPQPVEERFVQSDAADTPYGGIDIREVSTGSQMLHWGMKLRERPPLASALDPASRVIEHGLVFDTDRDGTGDCQIGINTDAPQPGQFRVWVKNLTTGVTEEKIGPPYGFPFDFSHTSESATEPLASEPPPVGFTFLSPSELKACAIPYAAGFYAYASVTENGQVTQWDYAPDDAWLERPN
jgi:hypothetical protein